MRRKQRQRADQLKRAEQSESRAPRKHATLEGKTQPPEEDDLPDDAPGSPREPAHVPGSLKAALVQMLPPDHPSLVGTIVRLVVVGVGVADYLHTQDLDRFLLICGVGVGGSYGLEHVGRQLLPLQEGKSSSKVVGAGAQQISDETGKER